VSPFHNSLIMSSYHLTDDRIPLYLARLRAFRPKFIQAYPSSAMLLAQHMLDNGEPPLEGMAAVLCGSENVYAWQRELIERAFGCRVFSRYGQSELVSLAGECESDARLHIFPQYGITELVDESGRQITMPGQIGEVVGTGFINRAMPLVRYRTMDVASSAEGTCNLCGRPYPRFERIEGRLHEFIVTSSGRHISMAAVNMHSPIFDNVRQFRFHQDTPGRLLMRLVPKPSYNADDERRIKTELAPKLGSDTLLELEIVETIPHGAGEKYRFLEQKLPLRFGDR
jgi:phenylacetate-CoA ligase